MQNEIVSHDIDHSAAIANFYGQNEMLADTAQRREYFASLDSADFLDLLQQTNSLIRSGDPEQRQPFDGQDVMLSTHAVPDHPDKEQLLDETWQTARTFLQDPNLDDEAALIYAGLTAAGGTLMVHPYIDGNGRTSRVISHMIINGDSEATREELRRIVDEHGNQAWRVTPLSNGLEVYTEIDYEKSDLLPEKIDWGISVSEYDRSDSGDDPVNALGTNNNTRALHKFMLNADEKAQEIVRRHVEYDTDGKPLRLDAMAALRELVHDPERGIGYAAQLDEIEKWSRADNVRRYLGSMRDEAVQVQAGMTSRVEMLQKSGNLNDVERAEVAAFGRLAVDGKLSARDYSRIIFAPSGINLTRQAETQSEIKTKS